MAHVPRPPIANRVPAGQVQLGSPCAIQRRSPASLPSIVTRYPSGSSPARSLSPSMRVPVKGQLTWKLTGAVRPAVMSTSTEVPGGTEQCSATPSELQGVPAGREI